MGEKTDLNWLEKLKRNSWEPEILISGIAIFALFRIPKLLDQLVAYIEANIKYYGVDIAQVMALFKVAIYWVIVILIIHLVVRSIWIGMIGLSYIFPNEINSDKLKLSGKFENELKQIPEYKGIINNLENLASALFSIAFLVLMSVVGAYVFIVVCMFPLTLFWVYASGMENYSDVTIFELIYLYVLAIVGAIAVIDFVSLGYFRRFRFISKVYWPIYKVVSILTLARFYRPIYYSFISNYKKWKIILFLVLFVAITYSQTITLGKHVHPGDQFSRLSLFNHPGFNSYYDDQNDDYYSPRAHIQSDIITGNTIRLFVVARIDIEKDIRKFANYDSLLTAYPNRNKAFLDRKCISEFYHISVADSLMHNLQWFHGYKSETKQRGYYTHIDVSAVPKGNHVLFIKGPDSYNRTIAGIPFYRE